MPKSIMGIHRSASETFRDEGRDVVFASAFEDDGAPRLTAIWYSGESNKTQRTSEKGTCLTSGISRKLWDSLSSP